MNYADNGRGILVSEDNLRTGGKFIATHIRDGEVIDEWECKNIIVNEGINDNLNVYLNAGAQSTTWYVGLYQSNYSPVATDTAANIAGNSTECSSYTSATRPQWIPAAASGQAITNAASRASFTFNASVTVYGGFLVSSSVIGGTAGKLFGALAFGASKAVVSSDQLLVTYAFAMSSI